MRKLPFGIFVLLLTATTRAEEGWFVEACRKAPELQMCKEPARLEAVRQAELDAKVERISLSVDDQKSVELGLRKLVRDPSSTQFGEFAAGRQKDGTIIVCGYVNAKNGFGGYVGAEPFIGILTRSPTH